MVDGVEHTLGCTVQLVRRPRTWVWVRANQEPPEMARGFQVLARRWVVERTLGWLGRWRRLRKDYEYLPQTSACVVYASMLRVMLRRLAASTA